MLDKELKLVIGALVHDIGKVVYRTGDSRKHSISGYEKIKEIKSISEEDILNSIRYHHGDLLSGANIPDNDNAYIVYIADNIAAGMDRRTSSIENCGFNKNIGLSSIFNLINGNSQKYVYEPKMLNTEDTINYPKEDNIQYSKEFYETVLFNITDNLKGIDISNEYINSLLEVMEANTSFIPSSTNLAEVSDISLFDHSKITAAISSAIYKYLEENNIQDYKQELLKQSKQFYSKEAFMMFSMDISGIQSFIYTVASEGALKSLRSRSFYLEILMENLIDELLDRVQLSRANLLYSGGGHAYILLVNTSEHKSVVNEYITEVNKWFIENFGTELYLAAGTAACSACDLGYISVDNDNSRYKEVFRKMSEDISKRKLNRYSAEDIIQLNSQNTSDSSRECKVCHRTDLLTEEDICTICNNIKKISSGIINNEFFSIVNTKPSDTYLPLPFGKYMISDSREQLTKRMDKDSAYVRTYGKNKFYSGNRVATKLWVGDYVNGTSFEELADKSKGIKRIAVLRGDVDNLGKAFVSGFESKENGEKYVGLSRTSTFSRKMSIFFKNHINNILENGEFYLEKPAESRRRNAIIVYAGGDDVFVIGSWDDIIGFAVDLYNEFKKFTQNTLTISAGIGIYPEKYPVVALASQTGELEEAAKGYNNNGRTKNAIALFSEESVFSWETFINSVVGDKFKIITDYFNHPQSRGKNFIYNLLELIRDDSEDRINLARLAYSLTRLEPVIGKDKETNTQVKHLYIEFRKMVYNAMKNKEHIKEVCSALEIYVYLIRDRME